jgi:hypothetical protein
MMNDHHRSHCTKHATLSALAGSHMAILHVGAHAMPMQQDPHFCHGIAAFSSRM